MLVADPLTYHHQGHAKKEVEFPINRYNYDAGEARRLDGFSEEFWVVVLKACSLLHDLAVDVERRQNACDHNLAHHEVCIGIRQQPAEKNCDCY